MKPRGWTLLLMLFFMYAFQDRTGTIKVRKAKLIKGLYILDDGSYYKSKLYIRLFDNNAAIFLNAPVTAQKAKDSTAKLLYTYRKTPCTYKTVNDSVYIEGKENNIPFLYRGIVRNGQLKVQKIKESQQTRMVFKKVL